MPTETEYSLDAGYFDNGSTFLVHWANGYYDPFVVTATAAPAWNGLVQFRLHQARGTVIASAVLSLFCRRAGGHIHVFGVTQPDAAWPADATAANALPGTSHSTIVDVVASTVVIDFDVTAIVQEIVNQVSFASGNRVMFVLQTPDAETDFAADGVASTLLLRPTLTVTASGGGGGTGRNASFFLELMDDE